MMVKSISFPAAILFFGLLHSLSCQAGSLKSMLMTEDTTISADLSQFSNRKIIPKIIEESALKALSFYPELMDTHIRFVFKQHISKSVMQAQPVFSTLLLPKSQRKYQINISALFRLNHAAIPIHQIPENIMIGWIGHELGHIMDYEQRTSWGLVRYGWGYVFSEKYLRKAEAMADTYAVNHGLAEYIVATKRFILNHAELPQVYKDRISRLYLSPDDIVKQVREMEQQKNNKSKPQ